MKRIIILIVTFFSLFNINAQTTLNEGFESYQPTTGWEGWQIFTLGGNGLRGWRNGFDISAHTGTGSAYSNIDNLGTNNWLVSPAITVLNDTYELKYWEIKATVQDFELDYNTVLISTVSSNPTSGDFVPIYQSNIINDIDWEERAIDLSSYSGQTIYIAFHHRNTPGKYLSWYLDDVTVGPSSFADGALTAFISPLGVSETPNTAPVTVTVKNLGTTVINDFDINWSINNIAQITYNATALNLQPGTSTNVTIGNYNFSSEGAYNIQATIDLAGDLESTNNTIETQYQISSYKDGGIIGITPEGMLPNTGNVNVFAKVKNFGNNTINTIEILWSVDDVSQPLFSTTTLNLAPGETTLVALGQTSLNAGLHKITANLNVLGDINDSNNYYEANTAINTFWESFEGNVFPPEGWSINFGTRDGVNFDNPVQGEYYYVSNVDDNFFGKINDTIFTPMLTIKNGDHFKFYIKTNPATPANHSLIWKDGATGEIHFIQNIANSSGFNSWELRDIDISAAAGINYIGILNTSSGKYGESKYDMFSSDAKLYLFDHDLKILNGDMYFLAKRNVSQKFECKIRNAGALSVLGSEYSIKLMESPNIELASVNGIDLESWEEATISINYTFSDVAEKRLFFKIEYAADQNLSNNKFRESSVSIVPNTIEISTMGSPDIRNGNIPFTPNGNTNSLGEDDMSQMLFYNNEFSSPGYVYGLAYKYDNLLNADKVVHYPLKVWISQVPEENLDNGWLPKEKLTLVFDGTIEILPGNNRDLYIPFNQPILINGIENVVIKSYQYDPEWPPSMFRFLTTNYGSGPTRSIGTADYYELDPDDLNIGFFSLPDIAYTRFIVDPSNSSSELSGVVYDNSTSLPIANANISIEGSGISTKTDANGYFVLPSLPYGNYNIKASFNGFYDNVLTVNLNSDNQTQDFYLDPLNEIQVTGRVFGNNDISTPLNQVQMSILKNGVVVETVSTNNNGDFIFPLVYSGSDYEVNVFMYGYYLESISISPDTENIDLGDIFLIQEFISPFNVYVNSDAQPIVHWKSPKLSSKVKLQKDLNVQSWSITNEPNENVWLGNFFSISKMTTLTSVEIQTGFYPNAVDYVTVDIFDLASNTVLATSEPFLMYQDSLITVDIPNIVVSKTILAMVHWQNNPASTNALALDYSDEFISNSAFIKYPDEAPQLLNSFLGSGSPRMSFLLRVNTLVDGNPITNTEAVKYNVYRGLASDFPNALNWDLINISPVSELSLIDTNPSGIDPLEYYRYAVESIYSNGNSEVTYSNSISGNLLSNADEELIDSQISVYPVPTDDKITIKFGGNLYVNKPIEIFNMLGQKVLIIDPSKIENGYATANVNALQSGIYFIKIEIDNIIINKKFIVK